MNDKKMSKNRSIKLTSVLVLSALMLGCASDDDESDNNWASTSDVYSASSITQSKTSIGSNGDIILLWQEQETEIRDDLTKDTEHTFAGTSAAIDSHTNIHKHKLLYTKTSVKVKRYDASADSWGAETQLREGFWEKSKSGILAVEDDGDDSKIVYEENINNTFVGASAVAVNASGNAIAVWIQLGESATTAGDAGASRSLFVSNYNAGTNTWTSPIPVSSAITETQTTTVGAGSTTASLSATGNVIVQNKLALNLNDSGEAELVWLGRASKTDISIGQLQLNPTNNSETPADIKTAADALDVLMTAEINDRVNVYQNTYDGSSWSTLEKISDGKGSVRDLKLVKRNQTSGAAAWLQHNERDAAAETCDQVSFNKTPLNLYANWYNSSGWHTTPVIVNNALGEVKDFSIASNGADEVMLGWSQSDNSAYPCAVSSGSYTIDKVTTIWASALSGDIDTDLTAGSWSTATNIQPDDASTTADESVISSEDVSLSVDSSGNAVASWVQSGDAAADPRFRTDAIIRANAYSATSSSWLANSFIVSDVATFTGQPIEKTIPNDHIAPQVVSTGANQFIINWLHWNVSSTRSGYQLFSTDYDSSTNTLSAVQSVSTAYSPVVNQRETFVTGEDVQMFWSQATDSGVSLKKSVK